MKNSFGINFLFQFGAWTLFSSFHVWYINFVFIWKPDFHVYASCINNPIIYFYIFIWNNDVITTLPYGEVGTKCRKKHNVQVISHMHILISCKLLWLFINFKILRNACNGKTYVTKDEKHGNSMIIDSWYPTSYVIVVYM